jgi:pre-mRNA-splicing factor RBM22/SLT11
MPIAKVSHLQMINQLWVFSQSIWILGSFILHQTSIFLSSLPAEATELGIRTRVIQSLPGMQPSQLKSVVHVTKSRFVIVVYLCRSAIYLCFHYIRCAFINFKDRPSAERAAEAWANGLDIEDQRVGVKWGRSRNASATVGKGIGESSATVTPVAS